MIKMIRKKVIFCDNLADYDTLGNWDENEDDVTYTSNNDYLDIYKTNSDRPVGGNYIDLTTPFDEIFNFITEIDFKVIQKSTNENLKIIDLIDGSTSRAHINVNLTAGEIKFYDTVPAQIGTGSYTLVANKWYRAKFIQSFYQQTSATGKISAYIKDLTDPNNDWEFIGTNSAQSSGIDDIRLGHPEQPAAAETYQYQFKNLIIYELEEFP